MAGKRTRGQWRPGDFKEYGGNPRRLPAGWLLADGSIVDIADYPRLYAAVGQVWRLGGDTYDTDLQFRVPDGTRLRRGGTWTAGVPIACAYPMDDAGAVAGSFGVALLPTDAPDHNAFTFTTAADNTVSLAAPADILGAANYPRPATVPMAVQYTVTAAELPVGGGRYGGLMVAVISAGGAVLGYARVLLTGYGEAAIALGQGGYGELTVNEDAPLDQVEFAGSIVGKGVAFYVNPDGTIGYTVGGTDGGTIPGLTVGATDKVAFALYLGDYASGEAGLTFSAALRTQAADITEPVPAGATDPCGNVIGELPPATSNVGGRSGSTSTGGHALTVPELPIEPDAEGLASPADYGKTLYHPKGAPGDEHSHSIDPEHVKVLVLVKT